MQKQLSTGLRAFYREPRFANAHSSISGSWYIEARLQAIHNMVDRFQCIWK